jgi:hypothetical protein
MVLTLVRHPLDFQDLIRKPEEDRRWLFQCPAAANVFPRKQVETETTRNLEHFEVLEETRIQVMEKLTNKKRRVMAQWSFYQEHML